MSKVEKIALRDLFFWGGWGLRGEHNSEEKHDVTERSKMATGFISLTLDQPSMTVIFFSNGKYLDVGRPWVHFPKYNCL